MKKSFIVIFLLFSAVLLFGVKTTYAQEQDSLTQDIYAFDIPLPLKDTPEQILYRKGYIVSYNQEHKIPNWVAWHLTKEHTLGILKRPSNAWHEDTQVPKPRAVNNDYRNSGWTRGHLCPAGDCKWDSVVMYESFLFTNACPQHAKLNSGDWNEIEKACRTWAQKFGDIYIVSGPILFKQEHLTIGENNVTVPEAFFKVVVCLNGKPKGIGFICRNSEGNRTKDFYLNSISQIERITGITFFPNLPLEIKTDYSLSDWE
ncbi:MAG: DNA/RNA non-specific endonuclease [Bacteroidales bacterium]|jgi:endonuclease G|nr:DNA/RNA non-specific endonuclease [Bacteroidales bacterium]